MNLHSNVAALLVVLACGGVAARGEDSEIKAVGDSVHKHEAVACLHMSDGSIGILYCNKRLPCSVVAAALLDPSVRALATLAAEEDPAEWLARNVQITLDESTKSLSSPALQVQLRGTNESELIPIVDALAKALREEIELTAHAIKVARRDAIRRQYEKVESELRELREKYKNLARVRTPRDADEQLLQRNLLLDHLRIIQRKKTVVAAIDAKLASHEGVPKGDGGPSKALADKTDESRAAGGESADRLALLKSREMATAELRELEKEAGDLAKEAEELGRDDADGELEARTKELLRFTSLASKLELELDKADIDIKCGRAFLIETRLSY